MMIEILTYLAVFCFSMAVWLPIYKHVVSRWVQEATIRRIESGDIDLNYLLDEGNVFDTITQRVTTALRHIFLAELGQLSRAGNNIDMEDLEPAEAGLMISSEILKNLGLKKPPAMITMKLAKILGNINQNMIEDTDTTISTANFDPSADFFTK